MSDHILIIGAGMATAYLLQEMEKQRHDFDITVIGDERDCCYNRVMLSSLLAGETSESELNLLAADRPPSARFIAGSRVIQIDTKLGLVRCDVGPDQPFDRLVIATGSTVARPDMHGANVAGVEEFRTLEDTRRLVAAKGEGNPVTVIGGGLLGLEAAHGLNRLGHQTTVLHRNSWLMNRQLDREGGRQLQRELESQGIQLKLDTTVRRVLSDDRHITGLELDNGEHLESQLLLVATGITPNKEIAEEAGLSTDRGILVDARMRTSADKVYALGECCQLDQTCFGLVAPIRQQAKVLAGQLLGHSEAVFELEDWPTQLKISGIDIFRAGELDDTAEQMVLRDDANGIYRRLVIREEKLIGAVLVGDKRAGNWYAELIQNRRNIAELRRGLMFGQDVAQYLLPKKAA